MSKRFKTGLVVGKFCPLHKGHILLIQSAIDQCEEVIILSYTSQNFIGCDADTRRGWLNDTFKSDSTAKIRIEVIDPQDVFLPDDSAEDLVHRHFCATYLLNRLSTTVQSVFSSEDYGQGFADYLSEYFSAQLNSNCAVEHVLVDKERTTAQISGTQIRNNLQAYKHFLLPEVYCSLIPKVLILGGESSGKTTLCAALATALGTRWVPEFGRELWDRRDGKLFYEDMEFIATQQLKMERYYSQLLDTHNVLICDTSPLTTMFYSEQLFNKVSLNLHRMALNSLNRYSAIYICESDIPFEQDGTRRDDEFRHTAFNWYVDKLHQSNISPIFVNGSVKNRCEQVIYDLRSKSAI